MNRIYSNHEGIKQAVGEHNDSTLNVFWIYLVYNKNLKKSLKTGKNLL